MFQVFSYFILELKLGEFQDKSSYGLRQEQPKINIMILDLS